MVLNMEPIPYIFPIPIYRKLFPLDDTQDHERDKLFGEMIGAIIVRTVGDGNREPICVPISPYQMVRSRFRGGVRTPRIIWGRLDKESRLRERAVDFVGADVMEP